MAVQLQELVTEIGALARSIYSVELPDEVGTEALAHAQAAVKALRLLAREINAPDAIVQQAVEDEVADDGTPEFAALEEAVMDLAALLEGCETVSGSVKKSITSATAIINSAIDVLKEKRDA